MDLRDFQRDCSFIESTIQRTYEEILQNGSYNCLSNLTDIFRRLQAEEADLLKTTKTREEEYIKLQDLFYEERRVFKRQTSEIMAEIGNLKDEIEVQSQTFCSSLINTEVCRIFGKKPPAKAHIWPVGTIPSWKPLVINWARKPSF